MNLRVLTESYVQFRLINFNMFIHGPRESAKTCHCKPRAAGGMNFIRSSFSSRRFDEEQHLFGFFCE